MLRLSKLEISGFKSFFEKAELTFPGAVTAVIGPNGCGKSNICDAVAWVLGEQSARVLRGEKMDDVIFNGSGRRRSLGMAEVILTLQSSNGDFPETEGRVMLGRRVYRDGEGEYFLNGRRVRLRDVQDVLFGTGLGVRAYSIIEQGKIDQVLSSKPQDRRRLIEEAAGITKYKVKKRAAELKLEETRANLTRLSDIVAEVERSVASLKRQASKAERYKERAGRLRELRARLVRLRYDALSDQAIQASTRLDACRDAEARAAAELALREASEAEARRVATDSRSHRDRARDELARTTSAVERDDATIEAARRAEIEIGARQEALLRDTAQLEQESGARAAERVRLDALRAEQADLFGRAQAPPDEAAREEGRIESRIADLERALDDQKNRAAALASRRAESRNRQHEADLALERVASTRSRLFESQSRLTVSSAELERELAAAAEQTRRLTAEADAARAEAERNAARRAGSLQRAAEAQAEKSRIREVLAAVEHRIQVLSELRSARQRKPETAISALGAAGIPSGGLLVSRLRPKAGWENVLDRIASEELAAVIVADSAGAAEALIRSETAGSVVEAGAAPSAASDSDSGSWESVIENFSDLPAGIRSSLPPAHFVESADEAREAARRFPGRLVAARSGEIVRGTLSRIPGRRSEDEGFLSLARDLEAAEASRAAGAGRLRESEAVIAALQAEIEDAEREAAPIEERRRFAEAGAAGHTALFREREEELRKRRLEADALAGEDSILEEEESALREARAALTADERAHAEQDEELRRQLSGLTAELAAARPSLAEASEREATARAGAEGARERLAATDRERALLGAQEAVSSHRRSEWAAETEALGERRRIAAREAEDARVRRDENLSARESAARGFEERSLDADGREIAASEAEEAVRVSRARFEEIRQSRFDAEILHSRLGADRDHSVEDARREFGVGPEELPEVPVETEEERLAAEQEAASLAEQIEKMGPVNVLAYEEHREQSERLEFLTSQRADLDSSIASLLDTIRKINATSSERFREAFEQINAHFSDLFQRLFRGGTAEMRLLDETDVLDSGIEITAHPPGKRNQSILLLSGGEKALTAIALLMAIFRYKPSPFCILDEVDAPLDDANIDRFARLIREMSEETQFITMTHNKRTMESADALWGVTMEEPGCSKLVSVKFD